MLQGNAMEHLFCRLREQAPTGEGGPSQQSGNPRELPSTSVVPLSLNSDAGGKQAAEKNSHSRRDWEEDGRSEMPRRTEEHRNAANRG